MESRWQLVRAGVLLFVLGVAPSTLRGQHPLSDDDMVRRDVVLNLFNRFQTQFAHVYPDYLGRVLTPVHRIHAAGAVESALETSATCDVVNSVERRVQALCAKQYPNLTLLPQKAPSVTVALHYGENLRHTFERARAVGDYKCGDSSGEDISFVSSLRYCTLNASSTLASVWSKDFSGAGLLISITTNALDNESNEMKAVTLVEWHRASLVGSDIAWALQSSDIKIGPLQQ